MIQPPQTRPLASARKPAFAKSILLAAISALPLVGASGCAKNRPPEVVNPQPLPLNSFARSWAVTSEAKYGKVTRLYVRGNLVFGYTDSGNTYILSRDDGRIVGIAQIRHGYQRLHAPVVLKDWIVFPTNSSLEIYDRNGQFVKSKDVHYSIRSDAVGSESYLYFGADFENGGRLVKVDVTAPYADHIWELMFSHVSVSAQPALMGDRIYAAGENGEVTAVSTDNREPVWPLDTGVYKTYGPIVANLTVDESGLYVASKDGTLTCLNRTTGRVKWQYIGGGELVDAPRVTKDMVFQHVPGVGLVALSKAEGAFQRQPRWVAPEVTEFLAEDDAYVYARRNDNAILAMEKATGRAAFTSKRRDFRAFAVDPTGGTIYAVTATDRILAIKPVLTSGQVGELVWVPADPEAVALAK